MGIFWSAKEKALAVGLVLLAASAVLPAAMVSVPSPAMDIYMYENAFNRGARGDAGTFGGPVGAEGSGSEDRLGQAIFGWNLAGAGIPMGQGAENYAITRVTVRFNQMENNVIEFDPTYDSYRTYLPVSDPDYLPDADPGRPFELYGLGLRNGYTDLAVSGGISGTSYGEGSPFGAAGGEHTRHAFAYSPGSPRMDGDVSENVTERFESAPFAIGSSGELTPGDTIPGDTFFTFEVSLSNPGVLDYFRDALNEGELGLALSSLHPTNFTGGGGSGAFPRFSTRETAVPFLVPQLEIEYTVIPEPSAGHIFILGAAALVAGRAWRRRDRFT
jgi:hypothetical protein